MMNLLRAFIGGLASSLYTAMLTTDKIIFFRPTTNGFGAITKAELVKLVHSGALRFKFGTATDATDIANGDLRLNNATPGSATTIYVEETGAEGGDLGTMLSSFGAGDRLRLIPVDGDGSTFLDARITSNTDSGAYRTIVINTVEAVGTFTANQAVELQLYNGVSLPALPGNGTFKLQSVNNVLQWTADS
jgi:hypothetical protein